MLDVRGRSVQDKARKVFVPGSLLLKEGWPSGTLPEDLKDIWEFYVSHLRIVQELLWSPMQAGDM